MMDAKLIHTRSYVLLCGFLGLDMHANYG